MSFLVVFGQILIQNMHNYAIIILYWQGFYIYYAGFGCQLYYLRRVFSMRLRHANLSRVRNRNQHLSKLQTRRSSYHSKTSAHRSPSLAICTNSQDLSSFFESGHFEAEITRGADNENIENIENISLSLLYNYSFSYSHFAHPMRI
jgi:hypothetical protein